MKKAFILLLVAFLSTGISFASFQVKKLQKDVSTKSITVDKTQNGISASSSSIARNQVVSENLKVSKEKTVSSADKTQSSGKDGTVAIVLAVVSVLFLPFGLHNWYLGRKKQALWQTLLVVPGFILLVPPLISWVWQLVDLVRLLANGGTL